MLPEERASLKIRKRASNWFCRLFRNNNGRLPNPYSEKGRWIRFGLGNETDKFSQEMRSSDYIGPTTIVITQNMIGSKIAIFTSIECKKPGFKQKKKYSKKEREYGQSNWIDMVNHVGGIAGFASCPEDFDHIMQEFHKRIRTNE